MFGVVVRCNDCDLSVMSVEVVDEYEGCFVDVVDGIEGFCIKKNVFFMEGVREL